jgi:hypothetical protein
MLESPGFVGIVAIGEEYDVIFGGYAQRFVELGRKAGVVWCDARNGRVGACGEKVWARWRPRLAI